MRAKTYRSTLSTDPYVGETIRARGDVVAGVSPERVADFDHLLRLVADGTLTVVHDQGSGTTSRDLDGIVDAHRRVDSGHTRGNIVVRP